MVQLPDHDTIARLDKAIRSIVAARPPLFWGAMLALAVLLIAVIARVSVWLALAPAAILLAGLGAVLALRFMQPVGETVRAPTDTDVSGSSRMPRLMPPVQNYRQRASPTVQDRLWRTVIDALPDAAIVLDRSGNVLHHNGLAVELFPRLKSGMSLSQASRSPELIEAVDRAGETQDPIEVQLIEHVPVERRISTKLSRLAGDGLDEALPAPAVLVSFRDLSEQDRLAQMRADFVANASHELRTPLASLRGYVETLQGAARNDPEARERFLASMAEQAARMTRLIDDLLSLSRIEMRQHLPPRDLVELNVVVASSAQMLEPVAMAAKVTLRVQPLAGPAMVRGDRDEIVQVLQNLIQNAIKYGREGGMVDVVVSREPAGRVGPTRLAVAVSDEGAGIATEHLPRLTERFYRVNAVSSRDKGGTGLGLAIVKHVMNRHRGDLRIASRIGHGSTFTVVFEEATAAT